MKIAIIGGIGSGKSAAAQIIKEMGYPVYDADKIYKEISEREDYLKLVNNTWPGAVKDGKLDREYLGKIVFSNKQELEKLNAIAHPLVKQEIDILSKDKEVVYVEVPVFVGSILQDYFDKVILVEAEVKFRISRIMKRSGYDKEYVKKIIASQPTDSELEKFADIIVENNKDQIHLRQQLAKVL